MLLFESIWEASIYLEPIFDRMGWEWYSGEGKSIPNRLQIMQELQDMRVRLLENDGMTVVILGRLMVCRLRDARDKVVCGLDAANYLEWTKREMAR